MAADIATFSERLKIIFRNKETRIIGETDFCQQFLKIIQHMHHCDI